MYEEVTCGWCHGICWLPTKDGGIHECEECNGTGKVKVHPKEVS